MVSHDPTSTVQDEAELLKQGRKLRIELEVGEMADMVDEVFEDEDEDEEEDIEEDHLHEEGVAIEHEDADGNRFVVLEVINNEEIGMEV